MDSETHRLGGSDCERLRPGPIAQPVNTLTSFGYVLAGGVVLSGERSRGLAARPEVVAFASLLGLVGVGSVAFHGPQPWGAKLMHDVPIPLLLGIAVATPIVRRRRGRAPLPGWSRRRGQLVAGTTVAALAAYLGGRTGAPSCHPDSVVQLHGDWHLLSAAAFVGVAQMLYDDGDRHD